MIKKFFQWALRTYVRRAERAAAAAAAAAPAFRAAVVRADGNPAAAARTVRGFVACARLVWVVAAARTSARRAREAAEVLGGVHAFAAAYAAEDAARAANREFRAAIRG